MTSTVATIPRIPRLSLNTTNLNGRFSRAAGQNGAAVAAQPMKNAITGRRGRVLEIRAT